jgi:hypothetical protein
MKWEGGKTQIVLFFKRRRKKNNKQSDPIFDFYFKWNDLNWNLLYSPGVDLKNVDSKCVQFHFFFLQILITPRKKKKIFVRKKKINEKVGRNQKMILIEKKKKNRSLVS